MRVLKNKSFTRFAKKESLTNEDLLEAVDLANRGLISANLGGGLIKQRISRVGQGKSGGFRTIIIFKTGEKAFLSMDLPKINKLISAKKN